MISVSIILWALAAICKALADTVDHHYDQSIFRKMNPNFWDRDISSNTARRIFGYKFDAWHLAYSLMIVLLALCVIFHKPAAAWYIELTAAWLLWIIPFNVFYNKIFM